MTEFLFYHLEAQPVEKGMPVLLEKSVERGWRVVVQTSSEERVDALDAHLWTFRDDSFLPHGTFREPTAAEQPVLLTVSDHNPNAATVRFLIDRAPLPQDAIGLGIQKARVHALSPANSKMYYFLMSTRLETRCLWRYAR